MPPLGRFLEMILYSLLNFLPFLFLALYPFRDHLRYSKTVTLIMIGAVTLVQIGLGIWAGFFAGDNVGLISLVSTLIYAAFYFWAIRVNLGKALFTLLMLSNISSLVVSTAKCLEGELFPVLALQTYRWSFSVMMIAVELLLLLPMYFYMKRTFSPAMAQATDNFRWRYLWLIPATFYLFWYKSAYLSGSNSLEIALDPANTAYLFVINLGAFLVYNVVVRMVNEHAQILELEAKNHQLAMQALQYENLRERVTEARRAKHDLRHHLALLSGFAEAGDLEGLRDYLSSFLKTLPEDSSIVFCEHYALNMLILYFAQIAKEDGVDFRTDVQIPAQVPVSDSDLSVLLGNLLENALDACAAMEQGPRRTILRGRKEDGCLLFAVDNTFCGRTQKNKDGVYLSTKHAGPGLGIESVRAIVARYNGVLRIEQEAGIFRVSVMLKT